MRVDGQDFRLGDIASTKIRVEDKQCILQLLVDKGEVHVTSGGDEGKEIVVAIDVEGVEVVEERVGGDDGGMQGGGAFAWYVEGEEQVVVGGVGGEE
jgi:hypothetical protein